MANDEGISIRKQCTACKGTGIDPNTLHGTKERWVNVVCDTCGGLGYEDEVYFPFIEKKRIPDIVQVAAYYQERQEIVSYEEFMSGVIPKVPPKS